MTDSFERPRPKKFPISLPGDQLQFEKSLGSFLRNQRLGDISMHGRSLPFGNCVSDRWERPNLLGFGGRSTVDESELVIGAVTVGEDTWTGHLRVLDGSEGYQLTTPVQ